MRKTALYSGIGILVFVFGFLTGFFWATLKLLHVPLLGPLRSESLVETYSPETSFWESIFLGGNMIQTDKMGPPPKGTGYVTGTFVYQGKSVPGITLVMFFNNKYKTSSLTTDADGVFTLRLPPGDWTLNMIQCQGWKDKPEGEFMLLSGEEAKLSESSFQNMFSLYGDQGKEIHVPAGKPLHPLLVVTIRPRIHITWPEGRRSKEKATIAQSAISWTPYPGATDYVVRIDHVTRESARSMTFTPIVKKRVTGAASLSLSVLPHASNPTATEEYSVTLQAYGSKGEFLSESRHMMGTFTLTDGNVLVENMKDREDLTNQHTIDEKYQETKVLNAAETLIHEKMFPEAEKLLRKVKDEGPQGKKELLWGYLYASKGECHRAAQFFEMAKNKGQECIPDGYKGSCK